MKRTWRGTWAGILTIIGGATGIGLGAYVVIIGAPARALIQEMTGFDMIMGAPEIAIGIVAIVGGIFALRRRVWRLALVGAILAIISMPIFGIPATIFVVKGKKEFA
ncbi:hypothetical protein ES703_78321 [subsurface metagenome]